MMALQDTIKEFDAYLDRLQAVKAGYGMLYWDTRTGGNKGGLRTRGKAMSILSAEMLRLSAAPEMKAFLEKLEGEELDDATAAKVRICRKEYDGFVNVPPELAQEVEEHKVKAEEVWAEAKNANDFALFAPYLKKNIEYTEQVVKLQKPQMVAEQGVYNALLDDYEPDLTTEMCDAFFAKLRARIVPLLKKVAESGKAIDRGFAERPVPVEKQRAISEKLAALIGYDIDRGMIKETEHPFSLSFSKYDSRITTHYYENDFLSSVFSVLHESGHSIYEQGKRDDIAETILDDGISMAIHESQSRFYENVIGRSEAFWRYAWPLVQPLMGEGYADITPRMVYEAANKAQATLIRIEADELTYALHIMVRYELEKEIFTRGAAAIDVNELPAMWNKKYEEYLGITPPDDKRGVLQDVHWSDALFGYFPSYALGNAYGAQMLAYMQKEFDVFGEIEKGNIAPITAWLNKHIHQYGSIYKPVDLFRKIAGEDLNADYYIDYLEKKYAALYNLQGGR